MSVFIANFVIGFKKDSVLLNLFGIGFIGGLILFSKLYIDQTFDGQAYHQEIIILLSKGWNPLYEVIDKANVQSIWVNHYPRAYETIAAVFYNLTQSITAVKFINVIFFVLSFLYPFLYFRDIKTQKKAFFIALIIALNPITLIQLMTNLIDGFLYSVSVITFFSYLLGKLNKRFYFDCLVGLLLLINVKFTGLIFGITMFGSVLIYLLLFDKTITQKVVFKKVVFTILLSFPFLFSPYVKNYVTKGHIFYPLMGINKIDFVNYYEPELIKDKGRLTKLFLSNFSSIGNRGDAHLKIPFTFTSNELQKVRNGAPHLGSFGVLWGGILILSLVYYSIYVFKARKRFKFSVFELIIIITILLMVFNKAGWWLRYTPYFWLTPLLLYLSLERYKSDTKYLTLLFGLVVINGLMVLVVSLGLRYSDSNLFKSKLMVLSKKDMPVLVDFKFFLGNKALFKEYKIKYTVGDSKTFVLPKQINDIVVIESYKNRDD
ncbi:MAG: hypothetical protein L3J45_00470 [Flavobacteriaceae bacterium]|nr:hypothetical protein [Flavobacteriaceae bacterium]